MARVVVEAARPADGPAIVALVAAAGLPTADLDPTRMDAFLVGRAGRTVVGAVAVDRTGAWRLLRSLAVAEPWRGRGLGSRLVSAAEAQAAAEGARHLALLTTGAAPFFEARGYIAVAREALPEPLRRHPHLAGLCPASAACLTRTLDAGRGVGTSRKERPAGTPGA